MLIVRVLYFYCFQLILQTLLMRSLFSKTQYQKLLWLPESLINATPPGILSGSDAFYIKCISKTTCMYLDHTINQILLTYQEIWNLYILKQTHPNIKKNIKKLLIPLQGTDIFIQKHNLGPPRISLYKTHY